MDRYRIDQNIQRSTILKILVAGGSGFLGKALVQKIEKEGHTPILVHSTTIDLSKTASLSLLGEITSDFIFHLAGKTGIGESWKNPHDYYQSNLDTTRHLLEYARIKQIPLHFVSGYVYGNQGSSPISEHLPIAPNNPYAHSKWMGEEMCRFYHRYFSVPITISRPFNIYGPRQPNTFFMPKMVEQLQNLSEINLFNPDSIRDYVYIDDVVDALIAIMHKGKLGNCYNIGTGVGSTCRRVVQELQKALGTCKQVVEHPQSDEIPYAIANKHKIEQEIGWEPKHTLAEGIRKTIHQK
jgi:nucleoside-diphosphate-sugar epimerase